MQHLHFLNSYIKKYSTIIVTVITCIYLLTCKYPMSNQKTIPNCGWLKPKEEWLVVAVKNSRVHHVLSCYSVDLTWFPSCGGVVDTVHAYVHACVCICMYVYQEGKWGVFAYWQLSWKRMKPKIPMCLFPPYPTTSSPIVCNLSSCNTTAKFIDMISALLFFE